MASAAQAIAVPIKPEEEDKPEPLIVVNDYPLSLWETFKYYTFLDEDRKWGPAYSLVRAARKEDRLPALDFDSIWQQIPESLQERPSWWQRFWDPEARPFIKPEPKSKQQKQKRSARRTRDGAEQPTELPTPPPSPGNMPPATDKLFGTWTPEQLDFESWCGTRQHPQDYDDEYYRRLWETLYSNTAALAETWFGGGYDLDEAIPSKGTAAEQPSMWASPLTEQFVQYARLVAHEDLPYTTWRDILHKSDDRKWLVVGVLAQIMERKIFNELLFGAFRGDQEELDRDDLVRLEKNGYARKDIRSALIRSVVEGRLLPRDFWDSVDDLTGKTFKILQPLLCLMQCAKGGEAAWPEPVLYQQLHSLLAFAGYLQVCIAISPSIFHWLSASPGARFDWGLEAQSDMPAYRASLERHRADDAEWAALVDRRLPAAEGGKGETAELDLDVSGPRTRQLTHDQPLPADAKERRVHEYHRLRGAKVKVAVFPRLTRYLPVRQATRAYGDDDGQHEGQCIVEIARCMCVYYQGLVYPRPGQADGGPLEVHLRTARAAQQGGGAPAQAYRALAALLPLPCLETAWAPRTGRLRWRPVLRVRWALAAAVLAALWAAGFAAVLLLLRFHRPDDDWWGFGREEREQTVETLRSVVDLLQAATVVYATIACVARLLHDRGGVVGTAAARLLSPLNPRRVGYGASATCWAVLLAAVAEAATGGAVSALLGVARVALLERGGELLRLRDVGPALWESLPLLQASRWLPPSGAQSF
ncbi:hypothetical protein GGR56DRAFT_696219 [Xylariaceae sp. FL0804]|nr:hypothetical protein GGR56DRAFT_696219 [Xylariaceae sp. FL0804]